jgi:hypothetical protein
LALLEQKEHVVMDVAKKKLVTILIYTHWYHCGDSPPLAASGQNAVIGHTAGGG